jgi:hypothetical protein
VKKADQFHLITRLIFPCLVLAGYLPFVQIRPSRIKTISTKPAKIIIPWFKLIKFAPERTETNVIGSSKAPANIAAKDPIALVKIPAKLMI